MRVKLAALFTAVQSWPASTVDYLERFRPRRPVRIFVALTVEGVTTCFFTGELSLEQKGIRVVAWYANLQETRGMTNELRRRVVERAVNSLASMVSG